ncbi:hypothetical protein [Corynebacterium doosanense]|uniref:Uncharacterized protein n=1 Tax=Corynebacterium doosanense CAU 212 = DSM 45436 TaxID=558173 RepID=A0A097IJI4_9CORY|nr:hypothetical protein [Corynebacterium doosanense]AIT62317.1 hypothetical protein CDOO_10795 [Corynebacterium doosanense CAU 212 = DSM 45436]
MTPVQERPTENIAYQYAEGKATLEELKAAIRAEKDGAAKTKRTDVPDVTQDSYSEPTVSRSVLVLRTRGKIDEATFDEIMDA